AATYEFIKDKYACIYRGKVHAKNVGDIDMYLVDHDMKIMEDKEDTKKAESGSVSPLIIPG
ncbi:MAG TPA: hypothetical protein VNS32_14240, partial [Flavisolibacter sp.]|nr:hypothetical protein [Flavisolibacter sp.]